MEAYLQSLNILSLESLSELQNLTTHKSLKKGEFLICEGQISKEIVFIGKGILRSFYQKEDGTEMTYCITFTGTLMTALTSFITGVPTEENIQAVCDTEIISLKKETIEKLYKSDSDWIRLIKKIIEQQYVELEKRIFSLQKIAAKERYLQLLADYPHYIQSIPLQYLASYLNITPRHLSRLRREIAL